MKPIVIYTRVSTVDQDYQSQIDDLKKWCKLNNFKVIKIFGEKVSGYSPDAERLEYDEMKKFVLNNRVNDIVVWEISRFSRSMTRTVNEIDFFTRNGINIHFKKEGIESISENVTNQLVITILSSMAQMERDTFIQRGNRGRATAVSRGRMVGFGIIPYGYGRDEKGIIKIDENEAKVIKQMFEMAANGITLYGIASNLNSLKVPTRMDILGKKRKLKNGKELKIIWKPTVIVRILKKTIYKGERHYKGEVYTIPSIVSEDLWNKVQERFRENVGYLNRTKYNYLFKGKIRCGRCERLLVTYHNKTDNRGYYLCCGIVDKGNPCNNGRYILSQVVDDKLYASLFNYKYLNERLEKDDPEQKLREEKIKQVDYYIEEEANIEARKKRLKKLYVDGYSSFEEFQRENILLENSIGKIKNEIKVLQNQVANNNRVDIDGIVKNYKDCTDFDIKREFVNNYINSIVMYQVDGANVDWPKPLRKNEKILYFEIYAFNYVIPIKVLLTTFTKNSIVSSSLNLITDYNIVVDSNKKVH